MHDISSTRHFRIITAGAATAAALVLLIPTARPAASASLYTQSTAATSRTHGEVDYATWQKDCRAVMREALSHLKQRILNSTPGERLAIVFDVDNTTLETGFHFHYPQSANRPVLRVARYATAHNVSLFFVTARPDILHEATRQSLEFDGYRPTGIYDRGPLNLIQSVTKYKTARRMEIESRGYKIIANIGNSSTDLAGGHAEKAYKLPDYNGQLS